MNEEEIEFAFQKWLMETFNPEYCEYNVLDLREAWMTAARQFAIKADQDANS